MVQLSAKEQQLSDDRCSGLAPEDINILNMETITGYSDVGIFVSRSESSEGVALDRYYMLVLLIDPVLWPVLWPPVLRRGAAALLPPPALPQPLPLPPLLLLPPAMRRSHA
eukprot:SAG31_NODE_531_length_14413_cov_7.712659_2_plen_111_part_00